MFQRCRGFRYHTIYLECVAAQNMHRIRMKSIKIPGSYSSEYKTPLDRYKKSAEKKKGLYCNSIDWFHQAYALQILQCLVYLQLLKICFLLQMSCPDAYTEETLASMLVGSYNESTHQQPQRYEYTCICSLLNGLIIQQVF